MTLTIHSAKTASRLLVKSVATRRRALHDASKQEEAGTSGATETREKLTASLDRAIRSANDLIADTERRAADYRHAAHVLRSGDRSPQNGPMARLASCLGGPDAILADLCADISAQAETAAELAQTRMDKGDPELLATAHLAKYLAVLSSNKFDGKRRAVRAAHAEYSHFRRLAK